MADETHWLMRADGHRLAYRQIAARRSSQPGLIGLNGFRSDMSGTKMRALREWARASGHACLCFDYFGHGASSGDYREGTLSRWLDDSLAIVDTRSEGPQILVGASMGAWIALLIALARPSRVAALVLLAPAIDFTEAIATDPVAKAALATEGVWRRDSAYGDGPYEIRRSLIDDGRRHRLLRKPIAVSCPVRILHGLQDPDVPWTQALDLGSRLRSTDVEFVLVKDGDHRLSRAQDLRRLLRTVAALMPQR